MFSDDLVEFLEAKKELDEARANFHGYDFTYFHADTQFKYETARDKLDAYFQAPR